LKPPLQENRVESEGEPAGERVGWQRLKERILARDGHRCRNCTSERYLEVHHWQPVAEECSGVDVRGYSTSGQDARIVPESGLVTLCQICHNALTEARKIVRLSEDSSLLGPVSVPERDWHNIFELWALNDRQLPMKVVRESWNQTADHYMLVERIEIRRWPYGFAWGRYFRNGEAAEQQKIGSAGSYQWRKL
jgi:hypothetical protein